MNSESSSDSVSEPLDHDLVMAAQEGDPAAFDELILRYQRRVYSVIFNMTRRHEDTNDLMYETFAKAYQHIHSFKLDSSFSTWLNRIAVNRTINFLRRNKEKYNISINSDEEKGHFELELIDESSSGETDKQIKLQELQNKLNESLLKLSEEHRAVVNLYDIQGLSHGEIAKVMGCSEGTVKSRLFYAHKQLQKMLKGYITE